MTPQATIEITGVANVAVQVNDPERALDFYTGTLGLETRRDATFGPGLRWIEVAPHGATTTIALAPAPGGAASVVDTGIRLTTSDADATHAGLKERGVDVDDILRIPGTPPMFSFRDHAGNTLYVVEVA